MAHAGRRGAVLIAAAALVLIGAGLLVQGGPMDRAAFAALNRQAPVVEVWASTLSVLGYGAAVFVLSGLVGLRRPAAPAAVLLVLLIGGLVVQVVKSLGDVPRPLSLLPPDALHVIGVRLVARSLPSGHAAMWGALAALVCLVRTPPMPPVPWRAVVAGLLALSMAGALARVVVGAHWPSDVLIGYGLGLVVAVAVGASTAGRGAVARLSQALSGRAGSRVMAALLVASSCFLWVAERDYPLAAPVHGLLLGAGLVAAAGWWALHATPATGPALPRAGLREPNRT